MPVRRGGYHGSAGFKPRERSLRHARLPQPRVAKWSAANGGMEPGLGNPLGAQALYIYQNVKHTLYWLHGTMEARSIGKAVSSGCVRLLNQDVIDLYDRASPKADIIVV